MRQPTTNLLLGSLVASVLLGAPALAQDAPPADEGWLDESSDPLAPDKAPPPPPAEEMTPAEKQKRERTIDKNYSDAQKTYQEILTADPVDPLERRIKNNERIVGEYTGRIRNAAQARRQGQVELYNRTFYLKQQLDKKQITPEVYRKLIAEQEAKFQQLNDTSKRNLAAWQKEVDEARKRLEDLRAQKRLLEAQRPRERRTRKRKGAKGGEGGPAKPQLFGRLRTRLDRLAKYETRHTMDGVHPRTLGSPMVQRPAED